MSSSPILSSSSDAAGIGLLTDGDAVSRMSDVHCAVDFVIGTGVLKVGDCLDLAKQAVIPLKQSAGADLRIEVHGVAIATGEIVIIDDKVALRISRIAPPEGTEGA